MDPVSWILNPHASTLLMEECASECTEVPGNCLAKHDLIGMLLASLRTCNHFAPKALAEFTTL